MAEFKIKIDNCQIDGGVSIANNADLGGMNCNIDLRDSNIANEISILNGSEQNLLQEELQKIDKESAEYTSLSRVINQPWKSKHDFLNEVYSIAKEFSINTLAALCASWLGK